ncbi:hypothetical protein BDA99DRAFT_523971 [Phascolomyces articulosus]|uniref:Zn(2)-C6 fungal-type domain-containing protein n=1 Tax=Phascolomyces articulosus TaxID=60185 RepID=A0AAD5P929_9FUNG|nr:hypothetical protein BDA99DRAFT_523971 [Phascolomyces articulosus]
MASVDERPIKRRLRQPLSCQRCRKHRSKCSRERPSCEQCLTANVTCEYLDAPGDLASTALRNRFSTLQGQIDSLMNEFGLIEQLVYNREPVIRTEALRSWSIRNETGRGVSIDTHMHHVEDIYAVLLQFALDNNNNNNNKSMMGHSTSSSASSSTSSSTSTRNIWLTRNNTIYPNIKLSHFTSLLPASNTATTPSTTNDMIGSPTPSTPTASISASQHDVFLKSITIKRLLELYPTCLLHGSILGFQPIHEKLLDRKLVTKTPILRLLYTSCMCYMLLHACYWHPEMIDLDQWIVEDPSSSIKSNIIALAQSYYDEAKDLVSTLYFEQESANVIICHAICNLVLYHIESGNTSVIYLYSGMAAQLAAQLDVNEQQSLILPCEGEEYGEEEGEEQEMVEIHLPSSSCYIRSIRWFIYSLDTSASHFHNKPYEVQLNNEDVPPFPKEKHNDEDDEVYQQSIFQWLEYQTCEITRDIRRTCFSNDRQQVPYKEIERIEKKLMLFETWLRRYTNKNNNSSTTNLQDPMDTHHDHQKDLLWHRRCLYMHSIRYYGHWILLHQTYIPTPLSVERCSKAAFALVDLFDAWQLNLDCYFRPCIHELKQACEILQYLVDQEEDDPDDKLKALDALSRLLKVILHTPVDDIARTRPFIQKVQQILASHHIT